MVVHVLLIDDSLCCVMCRLKNSTFHGDELELFSQQLYFVAMKDCCASAPYRGESTA